MVTAVKTTTEEILRARIAQLEAEALARLPKVSFKVSEKGAISMYGLQRFPVTLYASQWERVIANVPTLQAFIIANAPLLTVKGS